MKGGRILLFSGGHLGPWALAEITEGDFLLGVDRGTLFLIETAAARIWPWAILIP